MIQGPGLPGSPHHERGSPNIKAVQPKKVMMWLNKCMDAIDSAKCPWSYEYEWVIAPPVHGLQHQEYKYQVKVHIIFHPFHSKPRDIQVSIKSKQVGSSLRVWVINSLSLNLSQSLWSCCSRILPGCSFCSYSLTCSSGPGSSTV